MNNDRANDTCGEIAVDPGAWRSGQDSLAGGTSAQRVADPRTPGVGGATRLLSRVERAALIGSIRRAGPAGTGAHDMCWIGDVTRALATFRVEVNETTAIEGTPGSAQS